MSGEGTILTADPAANANAGGEGAAPNGQENGGNAGEAGGDQGAAGATLLTGGEASNGKPAGDTGAQQAGGEGGEATPQVPESYDLKLPDGAKLPETTLAEVAAFAKQHGLTQDAAQAVLVREASAHQAAHDQVQRDLDALYADWGKAVRADPEIAGADGQQLAANAEIACRAVAQFGGDELKKVLDDTGLGNNPAVIRAFLRAGRLMADDTFGSSAQQPGRSASKSLGDVLYPDKA